MHHYETVLVQHPETGESDLRNYREKIGSLITGMGGEVIGVEEWGMRELAYPILKQSKGDYTVIRYRGNGDIVREVERNFRISEHVMRYVSVRLSEQDLQAAAAAAARTQESVVASEGEGAEMEADVESQEVQ